MVLVRIAGEEHKLRSAFETATVGHDEAEEAGVEVFHPGEVETTEPEMAERELSALDLRCGPGCHLRSSWMRPAASVWRPPLIYSFV